MFRRKLFISAQRNFGKIQGHFISKLSLLRAMTMQRWAVLTLVLLALSGGLLLSGAIAKVQPKYVFKVATLAPDGVGWAAFAKERFFPLVEQVTKGEVLMDIYWGGVMGDDEDYIAKMRIDQLQGAGFSGAGAVMACPALAIVELPFLFNGYDEVNLIRTKLHKKISKLVEKSGYMMLMWADQDFDQIYSTKYEMRTPEDFKNSKILTWYGPLEHEVLKALGASPIPVNVPEVVTSMRSGVCDAAISPAIWWVGAQLYTFTKYINAQPIRYSPALIVATKKAWNRLPQKYHKIFEEKVIPIQNEFNEFVHKSNKECIEAMKRYGVKEVKMTAEEIEVFRKRCTKVWYQLADKEYPRELLDEIMGYLKKYRAKKSKKG